MTQTDVAGPAEAEPLEIERYRPPAGTQSLVPADSPAVFVARITELAVELAKVIKMRKLSARIGNKDHVLVEGWTFLGSMLGAMGGPSVFAVNEWSREYRDPVSGEVIGWEARVVARTADGREVGAAESMCTRREQRWARADDYAIRSMAQTRATSKALRMPLGFVVELAGYAATPAEEMAEAGSRQAPQAPQETKGTAVQLASPAQLKQIREKVELLAAAGAVQDADGNAWSAQGLTETITAHYKVDRLEQLSAADAQAALGRLKVREAELEQEGKNNEQPA